MKYFRLVVTYLAAGAVASLALAQGQWALVDCEDRLPTESQRRFEDEFQQAMPSSDLFVPTKSPRSTADVIRNLQWQVDQKLAEEAKFATPDRVDARFRAAWEAGSLRLEVVRVENWGSRRCLDERRVKFFYLVRARPLDGRPDIARIRLDHRGLVMGYAYWDSDTLGPDGSPWPKDLEAEIRKVQAWDVRIPLGNLRDGQYVVTESPAGCTEVVPCFAFRNRSAVYIESMYGRLYRLQPAHRAVRAGKHLGQQAELDSFALNEVPFSIGDGLWIPAVEITSPVDERE